MNRPVILHGLTADIAKKASFMLVASLIGYALTKFLTLDQDLKGIIIALFILASLLISSSAKLGATYFAQDLGKRYMAAHTGINEVFSNLESCKEDMRAEFQTAKDIRMLLQVGRREYGDGEPSFFWLPSQSKVLPDNRIRVLRASEDSPFLSDARAKSRGTSPLRWREDIRRLHSELELLRSIHGSRIEELTHSEPFLWRIFILDDTAYVSAYLHPRDNDRLAAVYKLKKGGDSLYAVFDKYFEYLWWKYDPKGPQDAQMKWQEWP